MKKTLFTTIATLFATLHAFAADYTINSLAELRTFIDSTRNNDYAGDTIRLAARGHRG